VTRQRWLARASVLLVCIPLVLVLGFAGQHDLLLILVAMIVVVVASPYGVLAHRRTLRLVALALLVTTPVAVAWLFARDGLLWVVVGLLLAAGLALTTGWAALQRPEDESCMPEYDVPPPRHPVIVMNPGSGGGRAGRFGLKEKAEALEVAGGDGTQAHSVSYPSGNRSRPLPFPRLSEEGAGCS
jgi:hypothetical protein